MAIHYVADHYTDLDYWKLLDFPGNFEAIDFVAIVSAATFADVQVGRVKFPATENTVL